MTTPDTQASAAPSPLRGGRRRRFPTRRFGRLLLTGALLAAVTACGEATDGEADGPLLDVVTLTGAAGAAASTSEWIGEPLAINFWYSTCAPCAAELADFAEVDAERDDVRFIGVNPLDTVADMEDFAGDRGVSYDLFRDELAELQTALEITSFPATVFVDAAGRVVETTGVLDAEALRSHLDGLVGDTGGDDERTPDVDTDEFGGATNGWYGIVRDPAPSVIGLTLPSVDDPGEVVEFTAAPGRIRVVYFGFTACPDVCPTTMADLAVALRRLGDTASRVDVALVSVDPERDREHLAAYATAFVPGADGLLTDDHATLRAAAEPFGADWEVRHLDDGTVEVDHTAFLYAVDDTGHLALTWQFGTSSDHLAADLTRLLDGNETT